MPATTPTSDPLVVSRDPDLLDDLLRLSAAAAASLDVTVDPGVLRRSWNRAPWVLVAEEMAPLLAALDLPRRNDVVLVGRAPESPSLWRHAVSIRADQVVVLPDAQDWLVERFGSAADSSGRRAVGVGVIGARGGAGASTLAASLGLSAARRGLAAVLIDADRLGGGIDLLLGCEETAGMRWPQVARTRGRVSAPALRTALPSADGLAVLSWDRSGETPVPASMVRDMVAAARRGSDLVLVDLPRQADAACAEVVSALDFMLLVATPDVRTAASAGPLARHLQQHCGDVRLVVRIARCAVTEPEAVAASLGLRLAGTVTTTRSVARCVDEGLGPLTGRRFQVECGRLLDQVTAPAQLSAL